MVNYMVAIDGSAGSEMAFQQALQLINTEVDHLFLIAVAERISAPTLSMGINFGYILTAQEEIQAETKKTLVSFAKRAKALKIKCTPLMSTSSHVGDALCTAAKLKEADMLVLGSRGMGKLATLLVGSVSKYCVENAHCNVIVVKFPPPATEVHTDRKEAIKAEEQERARRIAEDNKSEPSKLQHELDKHIAVMAEEEERWRRIHEGQAIPQPEVQRRKDARDTINKAIQHANQALVPPHHPRPPHEDEYHVNIYELETGF